MLQRENPKAASQGLLRKLTAPGRDIADYVRVYGVRALYGGTTPLIMRECLYIVAVTVASPLVTQEVSKLNRAGSDASRIAAATAGAFMVGAAAGMASAPFQTLSAMMKSEDYQNRSLRSINTEIFSRGIPSGIHRLWYGAATRSVRTGCASVLYFQARNVMSAIHSDHDHSS